MLVRLDFVVLPPDHQVITEDALLVKHVEESRNVLLHRRIPDCEVHANRLKKAFGAYLAVKLYKSHKSGFILGPMLDAIAFALKHAAKEYVVLEVRGGAQTTLCGFDLKKQVINCRLVF